MNEYCSLLLLMSLCSIYNITQLNKTCEQCELTSAASCSPQLHSDALASPSVLMETAHSSIFIPFTLQVRILILKFQGLRSL